MTFFPLTRLVGAAKISKVAAASEPLFHFKVWLNLVPATRFLKVLFYAVKGLLKTDTIN